MYIIHTLYICALCICITYMHTYIHTNIHTYEHTYEHTLHCIALHCIRLHYRQTDRQTDIHTYICLKMDM